MSEQLVQERVRSAVAASGESQRDFALAIGLESTKLSKALKGIRRFQPDELAAIARRSGTTVDWLLYGTGTGPTVGDKASESRAAGNGHVGAGDPRTRMLEAAWKLIAERGFHAVRVADIAAVCQTSSAAVHYYFPTKADILEAALQHCVASAFARQSAQLKGVEDARERLFLLIDMQLPRGQVHDEWSVWLQFWAEASLRERLREKHNAFYARWRDAVVSIIERGQRQGVARDIDASLVALQLTALTDGLGIQVLTGATGVTAETMRRALRDFVDREVFLPERPA
ncbi:MAG: TetR family transcriptional regulator C-terminal domain-containing protein [Haloechinothrix sp.]